MTLGDFMQQRVAALVRDTCGEFFQDSASSEQVGAGEAAVAVSAHSREGRPEVLSMSHFRRQHPTCRSSAPYWIHALKHSLYTT